jgi:phage tail protein X
MGTIQLRRGTAAAITSANPTLAAGEPAFETDTGKLKIGDGVAAWTALAYVGSQIKLDDLAAPDDNTDLNMSTSKHGLCPKGDNNASHFLNGQGAWAEPSIASIDGGTIT